MEVPGDTAYPQSNKFVTGIKIKATDDTKLNDSPDFHFFIYPLQLHVKHAIE